MEKQHGIVLDSICMPVYDIHTFIVTCNQTYAASTPPPQVTVSQGVRNSGRCCPWLNAPQSVYFAFLSLGERRIVLT